MDMLPYAILFMLIVGIIFGTILTALQLQMIRQEREAIKGMLDGTHYAFASKANQRRPRVS